MNIILNILILIATAFLTTQHQVGIVDKGIIVGFIVLQVLILYVTMGSLSRGANLRFGISSFIQILLPIGLVVMYFLNNGSLILFNTTIRIF